MNRRYKILLFFLSFLFLGLKAQDMSTIFINMPDRYLPHLEDAWRKDLVDLIQSGKDARLQNIMNGMSELKALTGDYLLLQSTEKSTVEMKLFPLVNNTSVICVVTTVYGPAPDSRVEFFSTDWEPIEKEDLFTPVTSDWFIRDDVEKNDSYLDALSMLDMELIRYQLSPDALTLTAEYSTPLYLSSEQREKVSQYIKADPKVYSWDKYHLK